ncbi:MAG TPA: hypothetical protein VG474_17360 [Solirubrobacteraceae bacterium]|nr:hypothetical protein [Solirubrobacteraceae bacterium]
MLTPIVTELPRAFEPVVHDSFIRDFDAARPRQDRVDNVVYLSRRSSRRRRSGAVPARAA